MTSESKIRAFEALGKQLESNLTDEIIFRASQANNWFTEESIHQAIQNISEMLQPEKLTSWLSNYSVSNDPAVIGLIMAGNIPMVGFHDLLCIIMSGNKARIKLSSKDPVLIPWVVDQLIGIDPAFAELIEFTEQLKGFDAIIATGSDNSSKYFDQYFSRYPNIIRKNRVSCAVVLGNESTQDLTELGKDIFSYYGLGCRNVSKIYLPEDYSIDQLLGNLQGYEKVIDHHKYANNYDYNKSIYLVNKESHFDNGFLLLKETDEMVSPISVIYLERYNSKESLLQNLETNKEKLQCIVSTDSEIPGSIKPGNSQSPELGDYADNIDTMEFLTKLSQ